MMLLNVIDLEKKYKSAIAVNKISFQIEKGECITILGPNGAGKTTTLQMLAGLLTPSGGSLQFLQSEEGTYKSRIGFLPQHPSFFTWMSAAQFLQFAGELSHIPKQYLEKKIDEVLEFVSLTDVKKKKIGGFSGGMKQRLGLAQALLNDPELLILDEPVSALDPSGRRDVLTLITKLKEEMTILFSTHVLHDAEQVCDKVIMLKDGVIKWDNTLEELRKAYSTSAVKVDTEEPIDGQLSDLPIVDEVKVIGDKSIILFVEEGKQHSNELLTAIIKKGLTIKRFERLQDSLEEAYMKVVEQ